MIIRERFMIEAAERKRADARGRIACTVTLVRFGGGDVKMPIGVENYETTVELMGTELDMTIAPVRPWTTLAELEPGAVFETRDGCRAVKSEYRYPNGGIEVTLLASGEYGHFCQTGPVEERAAKHNTTEVRKIEV